MEIEYGANVIDKSGKNLGTVNHIIVDSWTGKIRRFVVRREAPGDDLFLFPDDIARVTKERMQLNLSLEELNQNQN